MIIQTLMTSVTFVARLIEATIQFALDHEDLADEARAFMQEALARK